MKHKPYKPDQAELDERRKYHIGHKLPHDPTLPPVIYEPKTVTTDACVICQRPFDRPETVCNYCGNCQACGGLAGDRFSNVCHQCGNHIAQPRFDELGETIIVT